MVADIEHFRGENTGGTIQGREGLVKLRHVTADGRFSFHQDHVVSAICNFEGSLDTRHATTNHKRIGVNIDAERFQARRD